MKILFYGMRAKPCLQATAARLRCDILFTILVALLFSFLGARGQPKGEGPPSPAGNLSIAPLSVGDTLPPTTVQVSLPEKGSITIPQAGKLTILYFWHTTCTNCWGKLPFLNALQQKFGEKLNLVTITPEGFVRVDTFMRRTKKISSNRLPVVVEDSMLNQHFPYVMVSHVAWLDGAGRVVAITWPDYITETNIQYVLDGHEPNWRVKADMVKYDGGQPLLSFNKAAGYNLVPEQPEYIFWSRAILGLDSKMYKTAGTTGARLTFINAGYKSLVSMALGGTPFHPNRYRVPDTLMPYLFKPADMYYDDWLDRYTTCFEMFLPVKADDDRMDRILKDALESRLRVKMSYDTMPVPVWEISGVGSTPTDKRETLRNRVYDWNYMSTVPIVLVPGLAKTGFRRAPLKEDLENFSAFAAWCAQNNFKLAATTRNLRILKIEPKNNQRL